MNLKMRILIVGLLCLLGFIVATILNFSELETFMTKQKELRKNMNTSDSGWLISTIKVPKDCLQNPKK